MPVYFGLYGKEFAPRKFLSVAPFEDAHVSLRGKPLYGGRILEMSFFTLNVSGADYWDLAAQIKDAIDFLERHRPQLAHVKGFPGVEYAMIDFSVGLDAGRLIEKGNRNFRFSRELMKILGEFGLGIELTLYHENFVG